MACGVLVATAAGCRKEEIRAYRAPRDSQAEPAHADSQAEPAHAESAARPGRPPWTVPEGWVEKPSQGGMRMASYSVTGSGGRSAEVSIVALSGESGSTLDNVNRWRGEVGLGPVTADQLPGMTQTAAIGSRDSALYELVGERPAADAKTPERTLVAVLPAGDMTVFFKMRGEESLVAENKPKFLAWLKSVQAGGGSEPAAEASPGAVAPPAPVTAPQWVVPAGWESRPAGSMRVATFAIPGPGGASADMSVSALGPRAGGTLANVNRWRGQIGLGALAESDLAGALTRLPLGEGQGEAEVADMAGTPPAGDDKRVRILAAIVPRADRTWFYKMMGDDALVVAQKAAFLEFVKSARYGGGAGGSSK